MDLFRLLLLILTINQGNCIGSQYASVLAEQLNMYCQVTSSGTQQTGGTISDTSQDTFVSRGSMGPRGPRGPSGKPGLPGRINETYIQSIVRREINNHYVLSVIGTLQERITGVRLRGGNTPYKGRVEVYLGGLWGTICDDQFDANDGRVICRMLGFSDVLRVHGEAHFGEGEGIIWIMEISCNGNERHIRDCNKVLIGGDHACHHQEDSSVTCV